MKKWLFLSLFFIILMAVAFTSYLYIRRTEFLELALSRSLGTPVHIHSFDISKKGFEIRDIRIQNPASCAMKNAFAAEKVIIRLDFAELGRTLFGWGPSKISISQLKIEQVEMNLELYTITGSDNNWGRIIAKLGT